jgi:hypothetical protein
MPIFMLREGMCGIRTTEKGWLRYLDVLCMLSWSYGVAEVGDGVEIIVKTKKAAFHG